jgi:hypothetical protein
VSTYPPAFHFFKRSIGCFSFKSKPGNSEQLCTRCHDLRQRQLGIEHEKQCLEAQQDALIQRLQTVRTILTASVEGLRKSQEEFSDRLQQCTSAYNCLKSEVTKLVSAQTITCRMLHNTPLNTVQASMVTLIDACAQNVLLNMDRMDKWMRQSDCQDGVDDDDSGRGVPMSPSFHGLHSIAPAISPGISMAPGHISQPESPLCV